MKWPVRLDGLFMVVVAADLSAAAVAGSGVSELAAPLCAIVFWWVCFMADVHFSPRVCWALAGGCVWCVGSRRMAYALILACRCGFGPPFGKVGKEPVVLRLAGLGGGVTASDIRSFLESRAAGLVRVKVLQRGDKTFLDVAHVSFTTAKAARAAQGVDWKGLQRAQLKTDVITTEVAAADARKKSKSNRRTPVGRMAGNAPVDVAMKGIQDPWVANLTKTAYDAIANKTKRYEGRPANALIHVETHHLVAFKYNRFAKFPRVVCRVLDVRFFRNVRQMLQVIGWKHVVPWARSQADAANVYEALGKNYRADMKAFDLEYLRTETA